MKKRMLKTSLASILTLLLLTGFVLPKADPPPANAAQDEACSMDNHTFQVGEEIVYKLFYNWNFVWIAAGEAVFKVEEGENNQYHLSATGHTYKSYDWAFRIRDSHDAYVNKDNLLPNMSIRQVEEGGYRMYDKMTFHQSARKLTSFRGKTEAEARANDFDLDGCMHDMLSIIYYARNINFQNYEPGQTFPVQIFLDREVYPLSVKYKGKEESIKVKGQGRFKAIKFSPELIAGDIFDEDTQMNVYVSDDQNRIPLLIESPISVGSVKAVLKEYRGLKYDLTAKVD
ncbi:MAG: DUF3108 domain-containing protein [Bacteroidota bacterium]